MDALGLLNRRYWRDMETDAGRRAWAAPGNMADDGLMRLVVSGDANATRTVTVDGDMTLTATFAKETPPGRIRRGEP